ncbi:hypothetical protein BJY00DRAFT_316190 [Aspergillus carlsbadensis]|nr:hypothetical protein BJY00DRAFT_316190 [Aspergillus carlsbadensis]
MKLAEPTRRGLKGRLLVSVENRMSNANAQKFRKLQHDVLGLAEDEWTALHKFTALHEAIGVACGNSCRENAGDMAIRDRQI